MNFVELINAFGRTMLRGEPPIAIVHPIYGALGIVTPERGFVPPKNRWASTKAILRDSDRNIIRILRRLEGQGGAISNYDGIVSARGSGLMQDVWMSQQATFTAVSGVWLDLMNAGSWQPMTAPGITAYTNAGTGGAVLDAASNGTWLTNPTSSTKKYIVSMGLSVTSLTGFALAMLYDCLWAGSYSLITNATINPTTDVLVTRWANTTPGNSDYAGGNRMQCVLYSTLTHTVAATITTTYTNQIGTTGKTTISVCPATGPLTGRILFNTVHNSATVVSGSPFMPMTNGGDSGVTKLEQVVISGGTMTVGTVYHKIVRPLLIMPFIAANSYIEQDSTLNIGNMVELHNVSQVCGCLGWNILCGAGTTAASMSAFLRMVEG